MRSHRNWSAHSAIAAVIVAMIAAAPVTAQTTADSVRAATPSTTTTAAASAASVKVGGYIQVRETAEKDVGFTAFLNRARISADASLPHGFSARLMFEMAASPQRLSTSTVSLRDGYIRWTRRSTVLTFGQFKTPMSREYITSITQVETPDRAYAVDSIATKRDIGVMAEQALSTYGTFAIGVFNGEGQNASANRDSTLLVVARATARPIPEVHLGASGATYQGDSTRYGLEAGVEWRGGMLKGEYLTQHIRNVDIDDEGGFVLAGWRATPALQVIARAEQYERRRIGPQRRVRALTTGIIWEPPGGRIRLLADWLAEKRGENPSRRIDRFLGQLQVRF